MKNFFLTSVIIAVTLCQALGDGEANEWDRADRNTLRLSPREFSALPEQIVSDLQKRGCKVPQAYDSTEPHNITQGEFFRKGQKDWAVLCSIGGSSSILVYRNGGAGDVAMLSPSPDRNWLQAMESGIVYSRRIGTAGGLSLTSSLRLFGGPSPPTIDHQCIEDAFLEKGAVAYCSIHGSWLQLGGAD